MNNTAERDRRLRFDIETTYDDERGQNGLVPSDYKSSDHYPTPTDEMIIDSMDNFCELCFNRDIKINRLKVKSDERSTNLLQNNFGFTVDPGCKGFTDSEIDLLKTRSNIFKDQFTSFLKKIGHPGFILKIEISLDDPRDGKGGGHCPV